MGEDFLGAGCGACWAGAGVGGEAGTTCGLAAGVSWAAVLRAGLDIIYLFF